MEDGVGPHHVIILPQPPRLIHPKPRLETARPRLWLFEVRGERPSDGAAWGTLQLLARPVFIVGVFLNITKIRNQVSLPTDLLVELPQPVRLLHEGLPGLIIQRLPSVTRGHMRRQRPRL